MELETFLSWTVSLTSTHPDTFLFSPPRGVGLKTGGPDQDGRTRLKLRGRTQTLTPTPRFVESPSVDVRQVSGGN